MSGVEDVFQEHAPTTRPWFQIDRGGDAYAVLDFAEQHDLLVTVRATHNRRLWSTGRRRAYLWSKLRRTPVRAVMDLRLGATPTRAPRVARLEVRFAQLTLDLHPHGNGQVGRPAPFSTVLVRESGTTPRGERPIEWLLLTTHPVVDVDDASMVVEGYAIRWTVEEFHRAWKSGVCHVERTQLRHCDHILRWAIILAAVAIRSVRLAKLARSEPDAPASTELSASEIKAALIATRRTSANPTLGEIVGCIAQLGGYVGKSSGGPPGATVIARGLERLHLLALHLAQDDEK